VPPAAPYARRRASTSPASPTRQTPSRS